jgi:hypothetical protein
MKYHYFWLIFLGGYKVQEIRQKGEKKKQKMETVNE